MSRPVQLDSEAREIREALELAAARSDAAAAIEAAKRFARAGLSVSICVPEFAAPRLEEPAEPSGFGRPFSAKYAGQCIVCGSPIAQGAEAVYRSADRKIAHSQCGKAST